MKPFPGKALHSTRCQAQAFQSGRKGKPPQPPPSANDKKWQRVLRQSRALPANPRTMALTRLLYLEQSIEKGLNMPAAMDTDLLPRASDEQKQAQRGATALVAGVMRQRRLLDRTLDAWLDPGVDPQLRCLLRLAVHEAERGALPDHALTHTYVELTKGILHVGAGRLVNAVLRQWIRSRGSAGRPSSDPGPPSPGPSAAAAPAPGTPIPPTDSIADGLACMHSLPTWMVERWVARLGVAEASELCRALNIAAPHGLRLDVGGGAREALCEELRGAGAVLRPARWLPDHFVEVARGMQAVVRGGALARGAVAVQSEAAGAAVLLLDAAPGEAVLDACAAPGTKAMFLAARMRGEGRLVAADASAARLRLVEAAAAARGLVPPFFSTRAEGLEALAADGKLRASFDRVLLDAPCSGTGVLAHKPDIRWRRKPGDVAELVSLQRKLLIAAASLVKPGGVLVYSTCSLEAEENGEAVDWFLTETAEGRRFAACPPAEAARLVPRGLLNERGFLEAWPHRHGTDGAFAARLERLPEL
ncbi:hypothetical protein ACKKBF_B00190 [Auxenochlorella protothecoides x Auxenochlorella symbiontica]